LPKARTAALGDLEAFAVQRAVESVRTIQHPRYQFTLGHDSGKDWAKGRVPVLVVCAELDVQCDATQNRRDGGETMREVRGAALRRLE